MVLGDAGAPGRGWGSGTGGGGGRGLVVIMVKEVAAWKDIHRRS